MLTLPRGHALAGAQRPVRLESLGGEAWATARAGTNYADMFVRVCRSAGGFEPDIHHRVNDIAMLLDLVAISRVAALLPSLGHPADDPRVIVLPLAEGPFTRGLFVATRTADRARPTARGRRPPPSSTRFAARALAAGPCPRRRRSPARVHVDTGLEALRNEQRA